MYKENVMYTNSEILFSHKRNPLICDHFDETLRALC